MDDERGQLAYKYAELARTLRPRWLIWENVPNVLHVDKGRAFGAFIGKLAECGYHLAYRVLNLQNFGIPQRRRRLFVVGHLTSWRLAAASLFDAPKCRDQNRPTQEAWEEAEHLHGVTDDPCLGWCNDTTPKFDVECVPTLRAQQQQVGIISRNQFRKLTATEWERLMGVPDGYTAIQFDGKPATANRRCTALGNSFPVPVVRWIGERIDFLNACQAA